LEHFLLEREPQGREEIQKTGEKITIQARKAPGFTPGKTLKKVV